MKKRVLQIVGVFLVLLILGAGGIVIYVDQIGKWAVERGATYALGVGTRLGAMDIGILAGHVELAELQVDNPEGFEKASFLELGKGRVAVTLGSLMESTVELPELTLRQIRMSLERRGGKSNYDPIIDHLSQLSASDEPSAPGPAPEPSGESKKFVVRKISIEDVVVDVQMATLAGNSTNIPVMIDKIELTDVGSDSDHGVLLSELTGIITKAILTAVVRQAGGVLPDAIAGELSAGLDRIHGLGDTTVKVVGDITAVVDGEVKNVANLGKNFLENLTQGGADAIADPSSLKENLEESGDRLKESTKQAGEELKEGIGKLFGNRKKDDDSD